MSGPGRGTETARVPELLAPAGSGESLRAAIAAGADAVYLGGKRFGARQFAANFTPGEMQEAIDSSHLHGVRVYATVNTLVRESELSEALSYLLDLYRMGVDGAIIQDTGLLSLAGKALPGLPLHASTQATIATPEGAAWAAAAGYSRVILPRELSLAELDEVLAVPREHRPELEVFVHGALCYSYSGQCLLSSLIGGRSGNRGMCAQPCRKPYRLVHMAPVPGGGGTAVEPLSTSGQYLLSTRDLCCYRGLDRIARRDVAALKIEGRMRSATYVGIVVRAYRRALDALRNGEEHFLQEDEEAMALAFSRGFTGGYLLGDPCVMGRDAPGNRGLLLGQVRSVIEGEGLLVEPLSRMVPSAGDGILVAGPGGAIRGGFSLKTGGSRHQGTLLLQAPARGVHPGDLVYLTRSRLCREMMKSIAGEERTFRSVPADIELRICAGEPVSWSASVTHPRRGRIQVAGTAGVFPVPARTSPLTPEAVRAQVGKTGDSPFAFQDLSVHMGGDVFLPLSALNSVRREIVGRLEREWTQAFRPLAGDLERAESAVEAAVRERGTEQGGTLPSPHEVAPLLTVYCATLEELDQACMSGGDVACFEPTAGEGGGDWAGEVLEGARICRDAGVQFAWMWPRVAPSAFVREGLARLPSLFREGVTTIMIGETGLAEAICARVPEMVVFGGQGLNIANSGAALFLHPPIARFTLSAELPYPDIAVLVSNAKKKCREVSFEVICQGNLEAVVSRNRLLTDLLGSPPPGPYGLQDETKRIFPVYEDRMGRTRVLNSVETTLVDHVPLLVGAGVRSLAIDARRRGAAYVRAVVPAYREALDLSLAGHFDPESLAHQKERIREVARGGLTAGNFLRPSF